MKVRLTRIRYGPGVFQNEGDEIELQDDEARSLIGQGAAVAVQSVVETATTGPAENAARRTEPPSPRERARRR